MVSTSYLRDIGPQVHPRHGLSRFGTCCTSRTAIAFSSPEARAPWYRQEIPRTGRASSAAAACASNWAVPLFPGAMAGLRWLHDRLTIDAHVLDIQMPGGEGLCAPHRLRHQSHREASCVSPCAPNVRRDERVCLRCPRREEIGMESMVAGFAGGWQYLPLCCGAHVGCRGGGSACVRRLKCSRACLGLAFCPPGSQRWEVQLRRMGDRGREAAGKAYWPRRPSQKKTRQLFG